jgi:hypothetical protein
MSEGWQRKPPTDRQMDYLTLHKLPLAKGRGEANDIIYKHWKWRKALTDAMKKAEKGPDKPVHMVDYASQPNLRIRCDQSWTTPDLKSPAYPSGIYKTMDGRFYTFDDQKITCQLCRETGPDGPPLAAA